MTHDPHLTRRALRSVMTATLPVAASLPLAAQPKMDRAEAGQLHAAAGFRIVGDPGFCFPAKRWNGSEFKLQRWAYEGKACKPPR